MASSSTRKRARIKIIGKTPPRIRHTGPAEPFIDIKTVVAALDVDPIGTVPTGLSPPALRAVREEIANRLASTGGRPALQGTVRRQKIPLSDDDWARLRVLADHIGKDSGEDTLRPTPGQIASALLHIVLASPSLTTSAGKRAAKAKSKRAAERETIVFSELKRRSVLNSLPGDVLYEMGGHRHRWVGIGFVDEGKADGSEILVTEDDGTVPKTRLS